MHPEPQDLQRVPLFAGLTDAEQAQVAEWFEGELALLGDGRRHADVIAVTDVRVLSMFGPHFREMQSTMPAIEAGLERLADERLAQPTQPA